MSADSIIPFAFESLPVRGALIQMSRSWRRMQRDHDTLITETLGHAAAATGLIAQSLKFDGAITLQIQGSGAMKMLGEQESRDALNANGEIEVNCEYCGEKRLFDSVDVSRLFADNVVTGPESVQ